MLCQYRTRHSTRAGADTDSSDNVGRYRARRGNRRRQRAKRRSPRAFRAGNSAASCPYPYQIRVADIAARTLSVPAGA
eukprot:575598-Rhodomonas_salina.1